jgi:hypothetical protein
LWLGAGLVAVAAAAALIVLPRTRADARTLQGELAVLAGPAAHGRGEGDTVERAAVVVRKRWDDGNLRLRTKSVACRGGVENASALFDANGSIALLTHGAGRITEFRFYDSDGTASAEARIVSGTREEVVLPPLSQADARSWFETFGCASLPP